MGPLGLGMIGAPLSEELLEVFLSLQGRGAYPTSDDSARVGELAAWAETWGLTLETLYAVACNAFPSTATELLPEWERALHVLDDAMRTVQERQARVGALRSAPVTPSIVGLEALWTRFMPSAVTYETQELDFMLAEGSSPDSQLESSVLLPAPAVGPTTQLAIPQSNKRMLAWIMRRSLPVLAYGQRGRHTPDRMITDGDPATWAAPDAAIGAARIHDKATWTQVRQPSRFRDYSAFTRFDAEDWNQIQLRSLIGSCDGPNEQTLSNIIGERRIYFACELTAGGVATICGVDTRRRLVRVVLRSGTADTRPGNAGDTGLNTATSSTALLYTGTGIGAAYSMTLNSQRFYTDDAAANELKILNTAGVTMRLTGYVEISSPVNAGFLGMSRPQYQAIDGNLFSLSNVNAAAWLAIRESIGAANSDDEGVTCDEWGGFPAYGYNGPTSGLGGLVRTFAIAHAVRPASLATTFYVDPSIDWRDRLIHVEWCEAGEGAARKALFPGGLDDEEMRDGGSLLMYTGTGISVGQAALQSYAAALGNNFRIGCRSTDGALVIEIPTGATDLYAAGVFHLHVTDQLGIRSAAGEIVAPAAPADFNTIKPQEMNYLQDIGMASQVRSRNTTASQTELLSQAMPLGPLGKSHTPGALAEGSKIPSVFRIGQRNGMLIRNGVKNPTDELRQNVVGRARRHFGLQVFADGLTRTVDSSIDWRDRMISLYVAKDTASLNPGSGGDAAINTFANFVRTSFYSGNGVAITVAAGITLNVTTAGVITITNGTGSALSLCGVIEATFQLGPRSA